MKSAHREPREEAKSGAVLFRMNGYEFALFTLPMPVFGFFSAIILSMVYHFEGSTATHCHVKNYLPSISAAIGKFTPECYIWRICIALHCTPRLFIARMFYNFYMQFDIAARSRWYRRWVSVQFWLNVLEILSLVGLTNISSTENHGIHEKCFIGFIVFSQFYMLLTCILYKLSHKDVPMTVMESKSYRYKCSFFFINFTSFMIALYFFWRHNAYCEPGVYSLFALCEYVTVLSNMAFHGGAIQDWGQGALCFTNPPTKNLKE